MIKLFSVKVRHSIVFYLNDQWLPVCSLRQEKQKKDAAAGKGIKQSAGELRLQKGHNVPLYDCVLESKRASA